MLQDPQRSPVIALFAVALGLTVALLELGLIEYAFHRIGIDHRYLFTLLALSLLGSNINVPITRLHPPSGNPPAGTILAINAGGALIPSGLSAYLLAHCGSVLGALLATAAVALVVHRLAKPLPQLGIAVPVFVPPLVAAAAALLLAPDSAPAVAYIAGTLGTLIGADLTNLTRLRDLGAPVASIGGAGTFDGVFVTGILAVLLA
ncbi:MAG: DUF1614 domain-containing protein [Candidatus Binatia bacterium]